jgi:hypothetical protein
MKNTMNLDVLSAIFETPWTLYKVRNSVCVVDHWGRQALCAALEVLLDGFHGR